MQFKSHATFAFSTSNICDAKEISLGDKKTYCLYVSFIGLIGQVGILPDHYAEESIANSHHNDSILDDFYNIFNNRIIDLYYQAWRKSHLYLDYEQSKLTGNNDLPLIKIISSLIGIKNQNLYYYTGLLLAKNRPKYGLQTIIGNLFNIKTEIIQLEGIWISIDKNEQCKLCSKKSHNNQLGIDSNIGDYSWSIQHKFTLSLGPMSYQDYCSLLPNEKRLFQLQQLINYYVGIKQIYTIALCLEPQQIPNCYLRTQNGLQLGWNSWLKNTGTNQSRALTIS